MILAVGTSSSGCLDCGEVARESNIHVRVNVWKGRQDQKSGQCRDVAVVAVAVEEVAVKVKLYTNQFVCDNHTTPLSINRQPPLNYLLFKVI